MKIRKGRNTSTEVEKPVAVKTKVNYRGVTGTVVMCYRGDVCIKLGDKSKWVRQSSIEVIKSLNTTKGTNEDV